MPDQLSQLRSRVSRALSGITVEAAGQRMRAIVGPVPEGDAKRAIEKLEQGQIPTPQELAALEMLVRLMRPAPLCKGGSVGDLPADNHAFADWPAFQQAVRPYLYCIGRIDAVAAENIDVPDPPDAPIGTGFLLTDTLLLTNAHVLNILSAGTFALSPGHGVVRFKREFGSADEAPVRIDGVIAFDRVLDVALLRMASPPPAADGRKPLVLDDSATAPAAGQAVAAIGYPSNDVDRNPLFISAIFGDRFGVKRVAPGEVTGSADHIVFHDCSTLGGNSGSPVLSLATSKVIGLHRYGTFLFSNEAIGSTSLVDFVRRSTSGVVG